MTATAYNPNGKYQPESTIGLPAFYAWLPPLTGASQSRQEATRKQRRQST